MRYLLYFFYLEWYFGFRLAHFIIRHEITGEKKYGIRTIGIDNLSGAVSVEDRKHVNCNSYCHCQLCIFSGNTKTMASS